MVPEFLSMTYERCDNRDHPLHFLAFMPLGDGDETVVSAAGETDGYWLTVDEDLTTTLVAQAVVRNEMILAQMGSEAPAETDNEFVYDYGGYL